MSEAIAIENVTGTLSKPPEAVVRKALLTDVRPLLDLINDYASQGIMLPRTEFELAENIRDFTVALDGSELAGCGALHFYGSRIGEIRSLAVHPAHQHLGAGKRLMEALEAEAIDHGLQSVFAFTYIPGFFAKFGYLEVDRQLLPAKVWKDCLRCPKLQCCDEIAVRKILVAVDLPTPAWGDETGPNGFAILPVVGERWPRK
ncbi:MAG: N-acetyltransferase [Acidobacteriales bacterium]|nr:MAG: N-acetyltransferase [Terriglobales bacterium]